jgi:hypothetical protein
MDTQNVGSTGNFKGRNTLGGGIKGAMSSVGIQSNHALIGSTYVTFVNGRDMAAAAGMMSGNYLNILGIMSKRQLYSVGDDMLAVGIENRSGGDVRVFYYYNLTKHTYQRPAGATSRFFGIFFIALLLFFCGLGFISVFSSNRWTDGNTIGLIFCMMFSLLGLSSYFSWSRMGKIRKVFLAELEKLNIKL